MEGDLEKTESVTTNLAGRLIGEPVERQKLERAGCFSKDQAGILIDRESAGLGQTAFRLAGILGIRLSPHQKRWVELFDADWQRHLQLSPRGHGKTTVFGVLGMLSVICRNPKARILIISKTESVASNTLSQVARCARTLIERGEFPKFANNSSVKVRFEGNDCKEPSIYATGIGSGITGLHFDWIICDDIIDDLNSTTSEQRDKVREWFAGSLMHLSLPDTRFLVIGTRKHPDDIYGRLLKDPAWSNCVESAIVRYPENFRQAIESGQPVDRFFKFAKGRLKHVEKSDEGEVLWREQWDIDRLLVERLTMGQTFFDREKQNDVRFFEGRIFKPEWIRRWDDMPVRESMLVYIGCDLAISRSDKADCFALAVVGRLNEEFYLLDLFADRIGFARQAQVIREKVLEWNPLLVGIEDVAYQRALIEHLEAGGGVPVASIRPCAPKEARIKALQPLFESGKVSVGRHHENFIRELLDFPSGRHDDMIDAFEMAVSLSTRSGRLALDFIGKDREDE